MKKQPTKEMTTKTNEGNLKTTKEMINQENKKTKWKAWDVISKIWNAYRILDIGKQILDKITDLL